MTGIDQIMSQAQEFASGWSIVGGRFDGTEPDKLRAWCEAVTLCAAAVGEQMHLTQRTNATPEQVAGSLAAEKERDELRARLDAAAGQEPVAWIEHAWSGSGERSLHFKRRPEHASDELVRPVWTALYAAPVPAQAAPIPMSDERIDAIADNVVKGMPDGISGFMKSWGWRQFARALLEVCSGHCRAIAQAAPDGWRVTAEMVSAGELAWAAKERDMSHPTPTEFPEGGPAEACFLAMIAASPEAAR